MRIFFPLALLVAGCATLPPAPVGDAIPVAASPLALDSNDPGRSILGRLRYLGGAVLTSPDKRFGGFSSLKWRGGRLWAVTDVGDWASFVPVERAGRLVGAEDFRMGDLLDAGGRPLTGTATGDSESLTPDGRGWLVSFEHEHKILRYDRLGAPAEASGLDPQVLFGPLEKNHGIETLATRGDRLFLCAERLASGSAPNCLIRGGGRDRPVSLTGPEGLDPETAFPVDASWAEDGTLYVLFRSWSGGFDNRAAIVARSPSGETRTLALFVRPVVIDNWEGLAVRDEGSRRYLYVISDDNFHEYDVPEKPAEWQRTMLMKFELVG
ncbi:MAG: esterase-like activity of phytase family protein [Allosphingosinicella sp.]